MDNMLAWLEQLQERADAAHGTEAAYIHPRVLGFSTDKQKVEWKGYEERSEDLDVFAKLAKVKKDGRNKAWVAVVKGPSESYVGKESKSTGQNQWDLVVTHMWAVAIVNRGKQGEGKDIFIFDCDATLPAAAERKHAKDLDTQLQRVFVDEAKKWDFKLGSVHIGTAGEGKAGLGECVDTATEWVEKVGLAKGSALEDDDERFQGFVEIGKNT